MAPLDCPIPVTLIAGSFGAGKTTACNQLLELLAAKAWYEACRTASTAGDLQRLAYAQAQNVAVITHRFAEECLDSCEIPSPGSMQTGQGGEQGQR